MLLPSDQLVVVDCDWIFHRFRREHDGLGEREIETILIVETKFGREQLRRAQRDTLAVTNRALRELMPISRTPIDVKPHPGFIHKKRKEVVLLGTHLLRIVAWNDDGPQGIEWDDRPITEANLIQILNQDADPSVLRLGRKLDIFRRHKRGRKDEVWLFNPTWKP